MGMQPEVTAAMRGVGVPEALGSAPRERRRAMVEVDVGDVWRSSEVSPFGDDVAVLEVLPIIRLCAFVKIVCDVTGGGSWYGLWLPVCSPGLGYH